MVTAAPKPPKITAQLLKEYLEVKQIRQEVDRQAKPFADKEKDLASKILAALQAAGVNSKKAGALRANLIVKPGNVAWKDELVQRLSAEDLQQLEQKYADNTRTSIEVVEA